METPQESGQSGFSLLDELIKSRVSGDPAEVSQGDPEGYYKRGSKMYYDGFPYRGKVLNLKEDDPDWKRPQIRHEFHLDIFDLNDKKERGKYEKILQKVADKNAMISHEDIKYDEESKAWRVLLRWADVYYMPPNIKRELSKE